MAEYKVLITTSGVGSRLGQLTTFTNKCLVRVGKKPAISYIIEKYSEDIELVITLGYFGDQIKDFLTLAYPNRKFTFVLVDKYEGEGSSLGYSLLQAKDELQCPFIFHASDTIVTDEIKAPNHNWLGVCKKENHSQYRTIGIDGHFKIYDKGEFGSNYAYIGLAGINDFKSFWDALQDQYDKDPYDTSLSDCHAINELITPRTWNVYYFSRWLDIGNVSELKKARENIDDKFDILDKVDESIFLFDDFVIKFFYDETRCKNRVLRGNSLGGLTPEILGHTKNFYKYKLSEGDLFATSVNEPKFNEFLDWSLGNLWVMGEPSKNFKLTCEKFYLDKTITRLNKFFKDHQMEDVTTNINGYDVPPVFDMLKQIDMDWLCSETPYQFHGDFILDNIIHEKDGTFRLLDWRQDFGGDLDCGDIYYDLGKLNHNLLFNHDIVHNGHYGVTEKNGEFRCDILRSDILSNCRDILHTFIKDNGFDLNKVKLLTAIIWLNMSPLHEPRMGRFLFYLGKLNLDKILK